MTSATTEPGDPFACRGGVGTNSVWYRVPAGVLGVPLRGLTEGTGTKYDVRVVTGGLRSARGAIVLHLRSPIPLPEFSVAADGQEVLIAIVNLGAAGTHELPLPLPVTVQLQNRSGMCSQATYDTSVGTNEAGFYKGNGS